ncbi:MAG: bifunctional folylpolyglutamate synthase/dihydrofolate synthase [Tepidanaerobacter sp.]|jgi:dihydrofolate synthase/folylpolyglutamate synthase|nr:bifunctional folylpolyglutamate synthase/dihydrofolate synthase [Tepidanaerobacter sp.]
MISYEEALDFIHGLNRFGTKLGLHNITKLLELLGNPHENIKIIHVAGTNGKGSTCAMIASILRSAGFKVGLYISPYLEVFNERMQVNGENISNEDLARLTEKVREKVFYMRENGLGSPTEFEVVTAIGFSYFKEQAVDFLVLEVGMGGRLDATNVVTPLVSVITPISMDHQQYLGSTLRDISREKCGIIKQGVPVVTAPQEDEAMAVIEDTCRERNCSLTKVINSSVSRSPDTISYRFVNGGIKGMTFDLYTPKTDYPGLQIGLMGRHQLDNAATAVAAVEPLGNSGVNLSREAIYKGLKGARWPGRLEIMKEKPTVLIDGAHNIAGIKTLKAVLEEYFYDRKKILVVGILEDKDYTEMLEELIPVADTVICTAPDNPRALSAARLAEAVSNIFQKSQIKVYAQEKIEDALKLASSLAADEDMVVFAGSLYMIGHVRTLLNKQH